MSIETTDLTQPTGRRAKGVPKAEMHDRFPSLRTLTDAPGRAVQHAWVATFNARPDAMQALLADYIKQVHAKPGRIGQRPMPKESDVDFDSLVYGEISDEPLVKILPALRAALPAHQRAERAFCAAISMSRAQYYRLVTGEYHPNVYELRNIARALGKPPVYFVEYRMAMVVAAMVDLMEERPGVATALYQDYLEVRLAK